MLVVDATSSHPTGRAKRPTRPGDVGRRKEEGEKDKVEKEGEGEGDEEKGE